MKKILYILVVVLLVGCSTQRNTFVTRSYHNVTAKFNYLFNAEQSFSESIKKYSSEYSYSYNTLLPVFIFDKQSAPSKTADGCDRAILKSGLLIKYHSITVKPKNQKQSTQSAREFYNRQEFCNYVDDAYLLIGKGNAYQHDYGKARQAFEQVVYNYPKSNSASEAQLWLALVAGVENDLVQYYDALSAFKVDSKYSKNLRSTYNAAWADYFLKKHDLTKAIEHMEQAVLFEKKKEQRLRYTYILGQLYMESNNPSAAQRRFNEVAKKSSNYEMAFNAQLEEAMSFTSGNNPESLKNILLKMAKNQRNAEYRDQIYYTIGKLFVKDNNNAEALTYFNKSLEESAGNNNQKGITFLEIGNLAYNSKDFIKAQAFYDRSRITLSNDHPLYNEANTKAKNLYRLASKTHEYNRYDSLLRMASMDKDELNRLINDKIAFLTAQKEKEQQETSLQRQYLNNQNSLALNTKQAASWYFYNQSTLSIGATEFKMRWGNRKLEDNWRRKNKGNAIEIAEAQEEEEKKIKDNTSPLTREYYLKNIPKTEKEKIELELKRQQALTDIADAYRSDIHDADKAINTLDKLMAENPSNDQLLLKVYTVYYQAYLMKSETALAEKYKNLIVENYPKSGMAISLTNTGFTKGTVTKESSKVLAHCLDLLKASNYKECLEKAEAQLADSTNALAPQLAFIKALAIGGLHGREAYQDELNSVIRKFPNTEAAATAKEYVQHLDKSTLSTANSLTKSVNISETAKSESATKYVASDGSHSIVIIIPKSTNINQLKFDLVSFNLESYPSLDLSISDDSFDTENKIVKITSFDSKNKSLDYYYQLLSNQELINKSGATNFVLFTISDSNLQILENDKTLNSYSDFFMKNYLK